MWTDGNTAAKYEAAGVQGLYKYCSTNPQAGCLNIEKESRQELPDAFAMGHELVQRWNCIKSAVGLFLTPGWRPCDGSPYLEPLCRGVWRCWLRQNRKTQLKFASIYNFTGRIYCSRFNVCALHKHPPTRKLKNADVFLGEGALQ